MGRDQNDLGNMNVEGLGAVKITERIHLVSRFYITQQILGNVLVKLLL